jgi:MFS family permease
MPKNSVIGNAKRLMSGNIMVFSITGLLGNFARAMVFPYASLYVLALGGDARTIGWVNFLRPLAGLIAFPIAGYLTDRASRVKLIVLGNYLSVAFLLIYVLAFRWEIIAIASLMSGLVVLGFPPRSALIADSLSPEDRGRGIATMDTISSGLSIFAPYIAGIVVELSGPNTGVRTLYGAMLVLYLASAVIHVRFLKESRPKLHTRLTVSSLPKLLTEAYSGMPTLLRSLPSSLKALAGVIILSFMANGVASPFWVVYAIEQIGLSSSQWGLILLCETALRLLILIPAGIGVDRWGRTTSLLVALLLSTVAVPLFILAKGFTTVLLIRLAIAVASAITLPACTALMADIAPREIRGQVMAALGQGGVMIGAAGGGTGGPGTGFFITLPLMIASLAGGYLYAQKPTYPWIFVLIAATLATILTALFIRDPKQAEI